MRKWGELWERAFCGDAVRSRRKFERTVPFSFSECSVVGLKFDINPVREVRDESCGFWKKMRKIRGKQNLNRICKAVLI
jgi:hypothetical protein